MSKKETFNTRLEPFGDLLQKMYEQTREILITKTDDELKQIIDDTKALTETNCWWATYQMHGIVAYEAQIILQNRTKKEPLTPEA